MLTHLLKLINIYFLSWTLIFSPMAFADGVAAEDQNNTSASGAGMTQAECNDDPARSWDSKLNRCMYTGEAVEDREEYRECQNLEDEEARKKCHDDYAQKRANTTEINPDESTGQSIAAINTVLLIINWIGSSANSSCTSQTMFKFVAIGGVLAEIYFKAMAKKELEELKDKYKEESVNEDPFAAQVRSFNYLKDEQEAMKDYAKKRKNGYMILSMGYLATAVVAGYELASTFGTGGSCASGEGEGMGKEAQDASGATDAKIDAVKNNPPSGTTGAGTGGTGASGFLELKPLPMTVFDLIFPPAHATFSEFMSHPATIMTVSGISAGLTYKLMKAADEEAEQAEKNIELVDKILKKFENSLAGFCPSGRDDLSNPRCYCYTDDNKRNSDRSNSETCQALWAADDVNLFNNKNDYMGTKVAQPGCVTVNNEFDPKCKCRQFTNSGGQNACKKATFASSSFDPQLSSAMKLPDITKQFEDMMQGNTNFGNVNGEELANNLANVKRIRDQVREQVNKKLKKKGNSTIPSDTKLANSYLKKLNGSPAFRKAVGGGGNPILAGRPKGLAKALKEAEKKAGLKKLGTTYSGKTNLASVVPKKEDKFQFSLDDAPNGGVTIQGPDMDTEYDFAQNDIHQDEGESLFRVISNRYITSGLKRLFEEDGEEIVEEEASE